ncbi:MAG: DUF421 domain-containing protein [Ruminococcus sp.]|nr:DUF421 domain-containing protein [Ruminococcus sp.]
MLTVMLRAAMLYFLIIAAVRLMGKRQIGELQPSELVITILLSNIATLPIEDRSLPMLTGVIPIVTLVCLDVFVSQLTLRSRRLRKLVSGEPKMVISQGKVNAALLKELRFSVDDLMEALRQMDVFDISEVQLAVVETTGQVSVCTKQAAKGKDPPMLVAADGELMPDALRAIGRDVKWARKMLHAENCREEDVFIMTAERSGSYTVIKREDCK